MENWQFLEFFDCYGVKTPYNKVLLSDMKSNHICILIIVSSHLAPFLCRPQSHGHHPSHKSGFDRTSYDLNLSDAMAKFGSYKNTPIESRAISLNRMDHDTRPTGGVSNDSQLSRVGDSSFVAVANRTIDGDVVVGLPIHDSFPFEWTTQGDVYYESEGLDEEERSFQGYDDDDTLAAHADMNEVAAFPSPSGRISKRRRHQRSSPNDPDRRRGRRRQRLLLKTRNKDSHPRRRDDRFTLKSDGPGHVIFRAGEIKRDWCRTIPFKQSVTSGRCSKTVDNNLCYGQCNSFFIPQSEKGSNKVAFQSFSSCKPHRLRWVNVTLDCPSGRRTNQQKVVQKTILKVESCRCIAADTNEIKKNTEYLRKGHQLRQFYKKT
ncbi:hypothetical protein JTE90_028627 [Oedothorax gibbosus]|uniref:CTCK domain-containing protein n=1 Tax=Oedothorax gibbosus TaxID=931172 RepID=A0AAV6UY31_9ARAC|nr:hypothetical protein JTE90_028627 [Oedothorax gibbosus]